MQRNYFGKNATQEIITTLRLHTCNKRSIANPACVHARRRCGGVRTPAFNAPQALINKLSQSISLTTRAPDIINETILSARFYMRAFSLNAGPGMPVPASQPIRVRACEHVTRSIYARGGPCIIQIPSMERLSPPQRSQLIAHLYKCTRFSGARKSPLRSTADGWRSPSLRSLSISLASSSTARSLRGSVGGGSAQARFNIADRSLHAHAEYVDTHTQFV